jgi:hypothetical protein
MDEKIVVDGVCDAINENVGGTDEYGNLVVHTDEVLEKAKTIWASTKFAYNDLMRMKTDGKVIDLSPFMPYG